MLAGKRPELELIVAKCLMTWPNVEAEMSLVLAALLGVESDAAVAVFHTLRRSSSQREAISAAAQSTLTHADNELLSALLDVHKSIEAERNALAHGHFGYHDDDENILIWNDTAAYVKIKTDNFIRRKPPNPLKIANLLQHFYFYTAADLEDVSSQISDLSLLWTHAVAWLLAEDTTRDALFHQLCANTRIQQALDTIRQKSKT